MNEIDHKLLETGKKAILLVGMTKAGKSTTYNLISKIPMKAVKEGRSRCYELQRSKSLNNFAEVTGGITSCTLVPNIRKYKDCHLIDTAGYKDRRNYVGTIGVSYSLKVIF
jgi:predicted GTPase